MRLKEKVIIVTGGGRGIGRAYSEVLAREGARVVLADIADAEPAAAALRERGAEAAALRVDVAEEASAQRMAAETLSRFGRIDALVNNAALFSTLTPAPFETIPTDLWDRVMAVNVRGTFLCCKAVFPAMRAQGSGKIVNISSGTVFKGKPNILHYVTSKGAVIALTRALAREVGEHGICVNCIAPGFTLSDTITENRAAMASSFDAVIATRCLKRAELPGDICGAVVFLCSGESDFITGQTLVVDGGAVMH